MLDSNEIRLIMRKGPQPDRVFVLNKELMAIGRDVASDISITDPEVSRRHARLIRQGQDYFIEDLGSTNGTFVNRARITAPYRLADGDQVGFGETVILSYHAAVAQVPATIVGPAASVSPMPDATMAADWSPPPVPPRPAAPAVAPPAAAAAAPPAAAAVAPPRAAAVEPPRAAAVAPPPAAAVAPPPAAPVELPPPPPPTFETPLPPPAPTWTSVPAVEAPPPPPPFAPEPAGESREPAMTWEAVPSSLRGREPEPEPYAPPPLPRSREPETPYPYPPPPVRAPVEAVPVPPPVYPPAEGKKKPKGRRGLLIGCGCLVLLVVCAVAVFVGKLLWDAPAEFWQNPLENFNLLLGLALPFLGLI